jgi:LysR family transcriptional regulator, hydrogen peroxide-inducible genes activator
VPSGHPLAKRRKVQAADLESERFILMKEGHCLGDQVLRFCDRREIQPQVSLRSTQIETIKALVRAGLGISLIPAMAIENATKESPAYRSLVQPRPARDICALWPKSRPPGVAGQAFLRVLRACIAQRKQGPRSSSTKN